MNKGEERSKRAEQERLNRKEQDLLDGVRRGEKDAFDRIFEGYEKMVFRVAYGVVGEREAAKDVLQEVFLSVHKNLHGFIGRSSLRTWIYRITFNAALAQVKKRSFLPLFDSLLHVSEPRQPVHQVGIKLLFLLSLHGKLLQYL